MRHFANRNSSAHAQQVSKSCLQHRRWLWGDFPGLVTTEAMPVPTSLERQLLAEEQTHRSHIFSAAAEPPYMQKAPHASGGAAKI